MVGSQFYRVNFSTLGRGENINPSTLSKVLDESDEVCMA
jgi:hypothetical protein